MIGTREMHQIESSAQGCSREVLVWCRYLGLFLQVHVDAVQFAAESITMTIKRTDRCDLMLALGHKIGRALKLRPSET